MARVSKKPEVRRQELIDIAIELFLEKGYENVSVRDILKEVNGAPGMFYYYFKSKQEIYNEAIKQFRDKALYDRLKIINDKSKSIVNRFKMLLKIVERDIKKFYISLNNKENSPYEKVILLEMLDNMSIGVGNLIKEAIDEGIVPSNEIINKESSYKASVYLLHGCYGLVRNYSGNTNEKDLDEIILLSMKFILNFLNVSPENMKILLDEK